MYSSDLRPGASPETPCPDFTPLDRYFALELRAESIEQLSGGDALRRGESERIEAGRSDGNADLVAGRDRVQVRGTLAERTSRSLAVQAAHLDTTVDSTSDTWAGQEDTVLLAGHMHDTWNRGTAVVATMSDDTAAGGGVRTTAPLDLWVHGLMGLEERPGTCTADGVLAEACGTLYEHEYRTAVHAAGLAMFNGTLYQSVRNSFRPLMRVSMGVRNLIAAGGGGAAGDAPPASPAPATGGARGGAASQSPQPASNGPGAHGAQAATDTLAAGRGISETAPTGTEAVHLDTARALTREVDINATSDGLSELGRPADTAERLGELQDALRASETGDDLASGARASEADARVPGPPVGDLDGDLAAAPPDADAPRLHSGDPWARGIEVELGLLGGGPNDSVPPRPEDFDWRVAYREMNAQYGRYRESANPDAVRAYGEAIATIDHKVTEEFDRLRTKFDSVGPHAPDITETEVRHDALRRMRFRAVQQFKRGRARVAAIDESLEAIDQLTCEVSVRLATQAAESGTPPPAAGGTAHPVELFPPVPDDSNWLTAYRELRGQHLQYQAIGNQEAVRACERAIQAIDTRVKAAYIEFGGSAVNLPPNSTGAAGIEAVYARLVQVEDHAGSSGASASHVSIEYPESLHAIHRLTHELSADLAARADEFAPTHPTGVEVVAPAAGPTPPMPPRFDWRIVYRAMGARIRQLRESADLTAARAYYRAIQEIDAKVMGAYYDIAGHRARLPPRRPPDISIAEDAYADFHRFVAYSRGTTAHMKRRHAVVTHTVQTIDQLTHERAAELATQFPGTPPAAAQPAGPVLHTVESMSRFVAPPRRLVASVDRPGALDHPALGHPQVTRPALAELYGRQVPMPADPCPSTPTLLDPPLAAAPGGFQRAMLDPPVLDPNGGTHSTASSGSVAVHTADAGTMTSPRLGAESTSWTPPTATTPAPAAVAFDNGLQRPGGSQDAPARRWDEVPVGRDALDTDSLDDIDMPLFGAIDESEIPPHVSVPSVTPGPGDLGRTLPSVEDDFAVERALIDGRLPADFDASSLAELAHRLAPEIPIAAQLQRSEFPVPTIDVLIDAYRAAGSGDDVDAHIHALQHLRDSIANALASRYGHRTDPDWLAWVVQIVAGGDAGRAADEPSDFGLGADVIGRNLGELRDSPPPVPLNAATAAGPTESGAGALLPGDVAWSGRPSTIRDDQHAVRFGPGQTVGTAEVARTTIPAGAPLRWYTGNAPGFGRPAPSPDEAPFSQHGPIGRSFAVGEQSLETDSIRVENLPQPFEAVSPATRVVTPDPENIDWSMVDEILQLLGAPGHAP